MLRVVSPTPGNSGQRTATAATASNTETPVARQSDATSAPAVRQRPPKFSAADGTEERTLAPRRRHGNVSPPSSVDPGVALKSPLRHLVAKMAG